MKRFNFDDDESEDHHNFYDNNYDENDENDEIYEEWTKHQAVIQQAQIGLVHREQDQQLLAQAIKIAEKGFFWKFKSHDDQLEIIEEIYSNLQNIVEF